MPTSKDTSANVVPIRLAIGRTHPVPAAALVRRDDTDNLVAGVLAQ